MKPRNRPKANSASGLKIGGKVRDLALECFRQSLTLLVEAGDVIGVEEALEGAAGALMTHGNAAALPRLYGAADRANISCPMMAANQDDFVSNVDAVRQSLGATAFESAWNERRAMPVDKAVAHAMNA